MYMKNNKLPSDEWKDYQIKRNAWILAVCLIGMTILGIAIEIFKK